MMYAFVCLDCKHIFYSLTLDDIKEEKIIIECPKCESRLTIKYSNIPLCYFHGDVSEIIEEGNDEKK